MKIQSKLTFLGSLAVLATSPMASAEGFVRCGTVVDPAVCEAAPDDLVQVDPVDTTDGTDVVTIEEGEIVEAEIGEVEIVKGEEGEVVEPEVLEAEVGEVEVGEVDVTTVEDGNGEGGPIPLDWIKRGGEENPDVMFYNVITTTGAVFKGETSSPVAKQIGPDEKATAIEGRENAGSPQLNREKKGPVALIKKGRVFLR